MMKLRKSDSHEISILKKAKNKKAKPKTKSNESMGMANKLAIKNNPGS
jgi:hypothetical protein